MNIYRTFGLKGNERLKRSFSSNPNLTAFRDEIYVRPKQRSDRDMGIALVVIVILLALVIIFS